MRDISYNIAFAINLQKTFGQVLFQDEEFEPLLGRLERAIDATQKEMESIGVVRECADCAVNGEGTCCGKHTGYKNDSLLLFINLLLGKSLPAQARYPDLCYFLTEHGCSLGARHVICINFLCQRLRKSISREKLVRLQEIAGKEMDTLFVIEEYIKKKIGLDKLVPERN